MSVGRSVVRITHKVTILRIQNTSEDHIGSIQLITMFKQNKLDFTTEQSVTQFTNFYTTRHDTENRPPTHSNEGCEMKQYHHTDLTTKQPAWGGLSILLSSSSDYLHNFFLHLFTRIKGTRKRRRRDNQTAKRQTVIEGRTRVNMNRLLAITLEIIMIEL